MKKRFKQKGMFAVSLLLGLTLLVTGCGSGTNAPSNANNSGNNSDSNTATPAPSQEGAAGKDVYIVGTDAAYPPFEKVEPDGSITGFDMDVIKAVAEAAGIKIEVQHTGWDGLFDGIEKGKVDLGISTITITDDRKQKYDFSDEYFEANQLIMVPDGSPVENLEDLKGMTIGVQGATTGEFVVQKAFGDTYEGLRRYDDMPSAFDDMFLGRIDSVVGDNGVVAFYVQNAKDKKFKLIRDESFEPEYYGIIVQKGNSELLEKLNQGLKTIKDNGKLEEIRKQYFGE